MLVYDTIRFYPKGIVIGSAVQRNEESEQELFGKYVSRWLKYPFDKTVEHPQDKLGHYRIKGRHIRFNVGKVTYWGLVRNSSLTLDSHSGLNGRTFKGDLFSFHAIRRH